MNRFSWRGVAIIVGILVVVYALWLAQSANNTAHDAVTESSVAAHEARRTANSLADAEIKRAQTNCKTGRDLRQLLTDIKVIVIGPDGVANTAAETQFARRIEAFVGTNPACKSEEFTTPKGGGQ